MTETLDVLRLLFTELINHATLICVAAFILFMAWYGYKKGFMVTVLSLGSVVVTLLIDYLLLPFFMEVIQTNASLNDALSSLSESILLGAAQLNEDDSLSQNYFLSQGTFDLVKEIIVFIVIFIIMLIIIRILLSIARGLKKFKLIDWLDKVFGAVAGAAEGLIFVWIFMVLISLFSGTAWGMAIYIQIFGNEVLRFLYYINPVIRLLERLLL